MAIPKLPKFLTDLIERVVFTYAQAFLGLIIAAGLTSFNIASVKAAAIAAAPAALAVIKGVIAKQFGNPDSAGFTQ